MSKEQNRLSSFAKVRQPVYKKENSESKLSIFQIILYSNLPVGRGYIKISFSSLNIDNFYLDTCMPLVSKYSDKMFNIQPSCTLEIYILSLDNK